MTPTGLFFVVLAIAVLLVAKVIYARRYHISPAAAHALVESGALLLDVRSTSEFATGALPGAKNVPITELARRLDELPKGQPLVVYCASGMRSASAAGLLRRRGYEAHNLGPLSAW